MILITGITGLTGKFLYRELEAASLRDRVRYLVRKSSDRSWMKGGERIVVADSSDAESLTPALAGVSTVLHLAPRAALPNVLAACRANGVRRIFYVNSTGVYSKFKSSTHIDVENERTLKRSGLTYTILRPSMIFGNHMDGNIHLLMRIMDASPVFPILGKGEGYMQPVYAGDLAKSLASALVREEATRNREYDVAGKEPLRYKELLRRIAESLNKRTRFLHVPYGLALLAGRLGDLIPNPIVTYEKVLRLNEDKAFDCSSAARDLDYRPISFEEAARREADELRAIWSRK